ncbi:MAG: CHASE3 domain-containing protein, partial [Bacillota bacterium]|nr:CHASE3 domain-containing protein [Bacillota bacterium]
MFLKKLKIGQKMFLGFGVVTILMLSVLGNTYVNFTKQSTDVDLNLHTYNVMRECDAILLSLVGEETGARGFALTGKEDFLTPYNQGKADYEKHYNNLIELTADNFHQQDRLSELNSNYQTWLQWETTQLIDARRKVNAGQMKLEDVITVIQTEKGKDQMDNLRNALNEIVKEEQDLLQVRHDSLERMQRQTVVVLSLGGAGAALLAVVIALLVIRMVVGPIRTVTNTFKNISEGDADLEVRLNVNSNDELGLMSKYFNTFMHKLKELIQENRNQSWIKTGQAELNEKISGEQDMATLSANIINYIARYLDIQVGVLYIKTPENTFKISGSYACSKVMDSIPEVRAGEGILGQAVMEKQTILVTQVPEDYIKVASGLGETTPANIIAVPLVQGDEVEGIIELGAFKEFTDIQLKFLQQISTAIAGTIHSAKARIRIGELLVKTIEQSEELQTQQEELRQNNEELEEQTKALKESEAHLQRQQEELRVVNEELQERSKILELQKNDIAAKNESLRAAQKEVIEKAEALEAANNYKSEFLANMSHELRTPLNSIMVLSQMLAEKKDDSALSPKENEFARTIHSSGEDLLRLINDILDLSKVEAGKMEINLEELNISELAYYIERTFKPVVAKKGLYLEIEAEAGLPGIIISDSQRVRQIVNNLLSNAIKFTGQGGVTVTFHNMKGQSASDAEGSTGNSIGISVTDSGIGIPFEKQEIIFEAFRQSDGTTSRKYGGTGLGLSISRELARLLGGTISLDSEEGKGSTFTLLLPCVGNKQDKRQVNSEAQESSSVSSMCDIEAKDIIVKESEGVSGSKNGREDTANERLISEASLFFRDVDSEIEENKIRAIKYRYETKDPLKDKKILLADDDMRNIFVLTSILEERGLTVVAGRNGREAVRKLNENPDIDLVLMDIMMPEMDGYTAIQEIRRQDKFHSIPIIAITAKAMK